MIRVAHCTAVAAGHSHADVVGVREDASTFLLALLIPQHADKAVQTADLHTGAPSMEQEARGAGHEAYKGMSSRSGGGERGQSPRVTWHCFLAARLVPFLVARGWEDGEDGESGFMAENEAEVGEARVESAEPEPALDCRKKIKDWLAKAALLFFPHTGAGCAGVVGVSLDVLGASAHQLRQNGGAKSFGLRRLSLHVRFQIFFTICSPCRRRSKSNPGDPHFLVAPSLVRQAVDVWGQGLGTPTHGQRVPDFMSLGEVAMRPCFVLSQPRAITHISCNAPLLYLQISILFPRKNYRALLETMLRHRRP